MEVPEIEPPVKEIKLQKPPIVAPLEESPKVDDETAVTDNQ